MWIIPVYSVDKGIIWEIIKNVKSEQSTQNVKNTLSIQTTVQSVKRLTICKMEGALKEMLFMMSKYAFNIIKLRMNAKNFQHN